MNASVLVRLSVQSHSSSCVAATSVPFPIVCRYTRPVTISHSSLGSKPSMLSRGLDFVLLSILRAHEFHDSVCVRQPPQLVFVFVWWAPGDAFTKLNRGLIHCASRLANCASTPAPTHNTPQQCCLYPPSLMSAEWTADSNAALSLSLGKCHWC